MVVTHVFRTLVSSWSCCSVEGGSCVSGWWR